MAARTRSSPQVVNQDNKWVHYDFLKGKLRVRERYYRFLSDEPLRLNGGSGDLLIIPDGVAWRKYLSLFVEMIEGDSNCKFVLLESAVECMDYRNSSPTVTSHESSTNAVPEAAAQQERTKLQKMLQNYPNRVLPFCDLSVRQEDEDEWDIMGYSTMSVTSRSSHALLRAGNMIHQHCAAYQPKVLVLSSDPSFVAKFPFEDGVDVTVVDQLFDRVVNAKPSTLEKWKELKGRCEQDYQLRNSAQDVSSIESSQQYLSEEDIAIGLKNKTLVKGRLNVTKENPKEGFVVTSNGDSYFVNQLMGHFNRAVHQDIVALRPLPQAEWGRPVGRRRLVHYRDDDDAAIHSEVDSSPAVPSAKVVAIMQHSRRKFVATLVDAPMNDENACLVVPMDIRIPKIRIKTNGWRRFLGHRLLVRLDAWDIGSNYPAGHCVEILGASAELETEIQCLLYENQLHLEPFSASALACLPLEGANWRVPESEVAKRLDLRSTHRVFSVDPPGCQDIDDTMHARVLPNGDVEVGVHIADVTYFVPHDSHLDIEARVRGTTFYLVDRRFDMLPTLLSSDLCSLHGDTDRLAVSTIWTLSPDLKNIKSFWFGRTVVHNCQAMTYEQAHNILHDKPPDDPSKSPPPPLTAGAAVKADNIGVLKDDLTLLTKLARLLRKDREDLGGAVDLSSGDQGNELKFTLDENNNPTRVVAKKQQEIHHTIAEMMILANSWVAKTIYERMPNRALLRIHRSVEESRFEDLKGILSAGKIAFDGTSNLALATSLKGAETAANSRSLVSLFQSLATRAMSEAQYICTGQTEGQSGLSHYGLGLQRYTHFTSPIRRYADVVVHKQLLVHISDSNVAPSPIREGLSILPDSQAISILGGEGLANSAQVLPGSTGSSKLGPETSADRVPALNVGRTPSKDKVGLYEASEVSAICTGLNQQNRMAKISSMECQTLFLSLYFRKHTETAQAVVTNLRVNGFWVYIPRFDMRGPVYLSDRDGNIQIDPALLKLPATVGEDASAGFAAATRARTLPAATCKLVEKPEELLEVSAPGSKQPFQVHVLDVVTVKLSCDKWDTSARVPTPRIHLMAPTSPTTKKGTVGQGRSSQQVVSARTVPKRLVEEKKCPGATNEGSIYVELMKLKTPPVLDGEPARSRQTRLKTEPRGNPTIPGRITFQSFRNPDTHVAKQEASIAEASEAAVQRRIQVMASQARRSEFESTKNIERVSTARMQRLAANKRNTRKSKAK